jgi:ADP-ribose pyrophosphatase YjhB (NUDIX family)
VLLCLRAIEPRLGYWTLPAGFMEVGESSAAGARRETEEEACARIELGPLFSVIDVPHVEQLHIFYLARLLDLNFAAGAETSEVRLFSEADIPWDRIAFRTVFTTLRLFFEDRSKGLYGTHTSEISGNLPRPPE